MNDELLLTEIRLSLEEKRESLLGKIQDSQGVLQDSGVADHIDEAARNSSRELSARLASHESDELFKVNRALSAIDNGTYGTCESCGKTIPLGRMEALPYTTFCVVCQKHVERG